MRVIAYLFFAGTCRDAMTFYAETLRTDPPRFMELRDMPEADRAQTAGMPEDAVMNAMLGDGDFALMASDAPPGETARMEGVSIHLGLDSVAEAHRVFDVFDVFAEDGDVGMPMGETSWTLVFGSVRDRYGTRWMVSVDDGAARAAVAH